MDVDVEGGGSTVTGFSAFVQDASYILIEENIHAPRARVVTDLDIGQISKHP